MKSRLLLIFIVLMVCFAWLPQWSGWSAVTLKYFDVQWDESTRQVKLRWETASELDNLGFQVRRKITGSSESFVVVKLCDKVTGCAEHEKTEFVFASGDIAGGRYGDYFDNGVQRGVRYTYQLIAIDISHREEVAETRTIFTSSQAITISPTSGSTQPSISTVTATRVPPTATPRQSNPTSRRSPTPVPPTPTLRIIQPTATMPLAAALQGSTNTPESLTTETSTSAELVIPTLPLPSITLIFPDTPTSQLESLTEASEAGTIPQNATWFTPSRLLVIGLIVMVWVILGGWFIFALRKIQ